MNTGARTLKAGACSTNNFGQIHQQVEVIAHARRRGPPT